MEKPVIKFKDETIELGEVKAKAWRTVSKFSDYAKDTIVPPDFMIGAIVDVFDNPKVTTERIENEVNLEEIYPLFLKTYAYVVNLVTAGLKKVNAESKKKETVD